MHHDPGEPTSGVDLGWTPAQLTFHVDNHGDLMEQRVGEKGLPSTSSSDIGMGGWERKKHTHFATLAALWRVG